MSRDGGKMAAENRDSVTLLGLTDAELALHIFLADVADCMNQQQRLADENYQGQGDKSGAHGRLHDPYINKGMLEMENGKWGTDTFNFEY